MNVVSRFNKLFGIEEDLSKEKANFVNRINQTIINDIERDCDYGKIFRFVCYRLGENTNDRISAVNRYNYDFRDRIPSLRSLTNDEFTNTLKILTILYDFFNDENRYEYKRDLNKISLWIKSALESSLIDLGVSWNSGMFYPKGADNLDQNLIEEPFNWLSDYPEQFKSFKTALLNYLKKDYVNVIDQCYLTLEGLVRKILDNNKVLENNKTELLKKIKLSQQWKSILDKFTDYVNEYKRHASNNKKDIIPSEVEAILYFTGLLTRLIIESK